MESSSIIVVAGAILAFGLVSGRLERSVVTPPMAFVLLGLAVGPLGAGWLSVDFASSWVHLLAELTLVLILFTDASRIDLGLLRRKHGLPVRLLALGLPLTIASGTVLAALLFDGLTLWEAAVLAATLSPTDAALGQAVVSSPRVPVRIRQALNIESGLNDGIMLPVLLIFVSCAGAMEGQATAGFWVVFTAKQVVFGLLAGALVGRIGGKLVEGATRSGWMNHAFQQLSAVGLALAAYGLAELVHGNGFIAAFVAGLAVGNFSKSVCGCLYEFAEAEGQLLALLIFLVFGAAMVPVVVAGWSWRAVAYGLLSLTLVRMLPVAVSLAGKRLRAATVGFCGWFGPRGIASILFALLVVEEVAIAERETILGVVITTVLLSVFAHGLTAYPLSVRYSRRMERADRDAAEHEVVPEMPVRIPHRAA